MTYEELLAEAETQGIMVKEKSLRAHDGRIQGHNIAIRKDIPTAKKACVLAEEIGHYETTVGDILVQANISNYKQECHARLWAYNKQIGLIGLIRAFNHGCKNRFEIAEYLGVTEEFFEDALNCYRSKYGILKRIDNFTIYFEPFGVLDVTNY